MFNTNAYGFLPFAITQGYEGWHVDNVQVLVPGAPAGGVLGQRRDGHGRPRRDAQATFTVTRSSGGGPRVGPLRDRRRQRHRRRRRLPGRRPARCRSPPARPARPSRVPVNGDRLGEADESFFLNLSNPTGAAIADGQGRAAVLDDEPRIHVDSVVVFPKATRGRRSSCRRTSPFPAARPSRSVTPPPTGRPSPAATTRPRGHADLPPRPDAARRSRSTLPKDKKAEDIVEAFFVNLSNASSNAVILRRGASIVDDDVHATKRKR